MGREDPLWMQEAPANGRFHDAALAAPGRQGQVQGNAGGDGGIRTLDTVSRMTL